MLITARPPTGAPASADRDSLPPDDASPERIIQLGDVIAQRLEKTSREIANINLQTRLLSFNAQIEAARAGSAGLSFGVVAGEMITLANQTTTVARALETDTVAAVTELSRISQRLATEVRGTRLADMALTNIDLIDRNLYERSCDVRWWATDGAAVDALADPTAENVNHASRRLGVILKAYTVYFDIVLADLEGRVIANGRPEKFTSLGTHHASADWFQQARNSASGEEYGFQGPLRTLLAGDEPALIYSCAVREGGNAQGRPLGVLGIVFNWSALAETIVRATPVDPQDKAGTRVCIVAPDGAVLADSRGQSLVSQLDLPGLNEIMAQPKGFHSVSINGGRHLVGHAKAPGFETYSTGWHSFILQARR